MTAIASFYFEGDHARLEKNIVRGVVEYRLYLACYTGEPTQTDQPFFNEQAALEAFRENVNAMLAKHKETVQ